MDEIIRSGMKAAIDRLQQPKRQPDDVQVFGNFFVSNLRKIKDPKYREKTQRRLLQLLWDCIDEEPVQSPDFAQYPVIIVDQGNSTALEKWFIIVYILILFDLTYVHMVYVMYFFE